MHGTHADGSSCREGEARLPRRFRACCAEFDERTRACTFNVRYEWWSSMRTWVAAIDPSAGGGGVAIAFCPHCGARLQSSGKRGRWMEVR